MKILPIEFLFSGFWKTELSEQMWMGKTFTLTKYRFPSVGVFSLNFQHKKVSVEIFDSRFYMQSEKILNIPKTKVRMHPGEYTTLNLQAEYLETIKKPGNPCEESDSYSFTNCVKDYMKNVVGCVLAFDNTETRFPICTNITV